MTLELTADEVTALSAALNVAVKQLGICAETVHALNIHAKLEAVIKATNEQAEDAEAKALPN